MLSGIRDTGRALVICLGFYTRLPIGVLARRIGPWTMADFARAACLAPVAGAVLGAIAGAVLLGGSALALPASLAASLAVASMVVASGALHEDGLADVADGFGGGKTRARKLEIMRDSRIGTFGTIALIVSLGLRIAATAAAAGHSGPVGAAAGLIGGAAVSRGLGLVPLWRLRPARTDGLAHAAGLIGTPPMAVAAALGTALGLGIPLLAGLPAWRCVAACAFCGIGCCSVTLLAARQIGGQTGDVAGAAQQVGEIAYWVGLSLASEAG